MHTFVPELELREDGSRVLHHVIKDVEYVVQISMEPRGCAGHILRVLSFRQGTEQLSMEWQNVTVLAPGTLLLGKKPVVQAECLPNGGPIVVEAELVPFGADYLTVIQESYADGMRERAQLQREHMRLSAECEAMREENRAYQRLVNQKDLYCLELEQKLARYEKTFAIRLRSFFLRLANQGKNRIKQTMKNMHIKQILKRIYKKVTGK